MNNLGKKVEIFVIVTVIALIGVIYAFKQKPAPLAYNNSTPSNQQDDSDSAAMPNTGTSVRPGFGQNPQDDQQQVPSTVITYQGETGKNALDLLKAGHKVEATHYSYGDLVTSIDGTAPDSKHFWAMYVNEKFSQVGASDYQTKSTDTIKWEIDAIVDTTK